VITRPLFLFQPASSVCPPIGSDRVPTRLGGLPCGAAVGGSSCTRTLSSLHAYVPSFTEVGALAGCNLLFPASTFLCSRVGGVHKGYPYQTLRRPLTWNYICDAVQFCRTSAEILPDFTVATICSVFVLSLCWLHM
jgi:hypothetical protein